MEGTHLAVEFMSLTRGGKGGVVINVSSMGGLSHRGNHYICTYTPAAGILPMTYAPNYSASKCGIVGFTRSMTVSASSACWPLTAARSQDCLTRDGVAVNCVCPQYTDTDMVTEVLMPNLTRDQVQMVHSLGLLR